MNPIPLASLAVLVLLGLVACEPEVQAKSDPEPETASASEKKDVYSEKVAGKYVLSETVSVGKEAPDFTINDENGKEWKLSDYKGKVVLLDFWGFWCGFCVEELPELKEINDELSKKDFVMIGINTDSGEFEDIKKELDDSPVNWRQGMVGDGHPLAEDYEVRSFPTKVLIDKDGKIVYIDNYIEKSEIEKYLE